MEIKYGEPVRKTYAGENVLQSYTIVTRRSKPFTNPYTGAKYLLVMEEFSFLGHEDNVETTYLIYLLDGKGSGKIVGLVEESDYENPETPEEVFEKFLLSP